VFVSYVRAANVGDSCFMVVRRGRVLFRSPSQQHEFNFPFQLGGEGSDKVSDAQCFMVPVQVGDVVVMGTDGLFDNVFDKDVALMAARGLKVRGRHRLCLLRGVQCSCMRDVKSSRKCPPR
jgi:serine/threonine protein phosphatase PrpC